MTGRTGHTAFSNAWMIVASPDDDVDGITREIVAGNDGIADQLLVRESLANSFDRIADFEAMGMKFPRTVDGEYARRPTRGLDLARVMCPEGGGLEFCWRLRLALEEKGVALLDRLFVTGLVGGPSGRIVGATAIHSRTGEFHRHQGARDDRRHQRDHVPLAASCATSLAPARCSPIAPAPRCAMRNSATSGRARRSFTSKASRSRSRRARASPTPRVKPSCARYEPEWADEADVPRIARAMAEEKMNGNDPLYLDMSPIPEAMRDHFIHSKVKWMDYFFRKLGSEANTDMFGKTPYYALNQMTKMAIRTGQDCRSDVPGLLAAGLAQSGCANHFAGFHIGLCVGNGWVAGRSAVEDLDRSPAPGINLAEVEAMHDEATATDTARRPRPSRIASCATCRRSCSPTISACSNAPTGLQAACGKIERLAEEFRDIAAPHVHELVRLKETEAMLLAARFILRRVALSHRVAPQPLPRGF